MANKKNATNTKNSEKVFNVKGCECRGDNTFSGTISTDIKLKKDEIEQVRWVSKDELVGFDFCFNCKNEIDMFFEKYIIENKKRG